MKKTYKIICAIALSIGLSTQANAAFINGSISFSGGLDAATLGDVVSPLVTFTPSGLVLASGSTGTENDPNPGDPGGFDLFGPYGNQDGLAQAFVFSDIGAQNTIIFTTTDYTFELFLTANRAPSALVCNGAGLCTDSTALDVSGSVYPTVPTPGIDPTSFAGTYTANGSCQGPANGNSCTSDRTGSWSASLTALGVEPPRQTPEPEALALLALGLLGATAARRNKA